MPIPSFNELLSQARNISQRKAEAQEVDTTGLGITKSMKFLETLLTSRSGQERKEFTGQLGMTGEFIPFEEPRVTGRNLLEKMMGVQGTENVTRPMLTADQASEFGMQKSILGAKEKQRGEYQVKAEKARARTNLLLSGFKGKITEFERGKLLTDSLKETNEMIKMGKLLRDDVTILQLDADRIQKELNSISMTSDINRPELIRRLIKEKGYSRIQAEAYANSVLGK